MFEIMKGMTKINHHEGSRDDINSATALENPRFDIGSSEERK
jgi:hypothetical protein